MAASLCIDEALTLEVKDVEIPLTIRSDEEASEAGTEEILLSSDDEDDDVEVLADFVSPQAKNRLFSAAKSAQPGSDVLVLLPGEINWRIAVFVIHVLGDDGDDLVEVILEDGTRTTVETHCVASAEPPEALVVGDRVIFDNTPSPEEAAEDEEEHERARRPNFCAGFVTEMATNQNFERYLVFMETEDTARYLPREQLRKPFAYPSTVPPQFVAAMKNYTRKSDRFLLTLHPGETVCVAVQEVKKRKYVKATVEKVDCSVALLLLKEAKKREWIWRGSIRFQVIKEKYDEAKKLKAKHKETGNVSLEIPKEENKETTELRMDVDETNAEKQPEEPRTRMTARKSTRAGKEKSEPGGQLSKGIVVKRIFPDLSPGLPLEIFPPGHTCSAQCSITTRSTPQKAGLFQYLKRKAQIGLLDWPRIMGFRRTVSRQRVKVSWRGRGRGRGGKGKGRMKWLMKVDYFAPCGRKLVDEEDVLEYLIMTQSMLSVDMFCFSPDVDPRKEFIADEHLESLGKVSIPEQALPYALSWKDEVTGELHHLVKDLSKDFSEGQESLSILWVDAFNTDQKPQLVKYLSGTVAEGIEMNTGPRQFRSCCDCKNGCADWKTCACRRLTNETARSPNSKKIKDVTYQYRRLLDKVTTGVFECNSDCACAASPQHCVNRVGQTQISVKLELVMTDPKQAKGWAVRALQDIPEGAFICSYAGEILHDRKANKDGTLFDDKYFLELDYITVNEEHKEGYEEDVVEPDEEEPMEIEQPKDGESAGQLSGDSAKPIEAKEAFSLVDVLGDQYVMDSLKMGNIGRFFNHSCEPNLLPQTVFVETHDPRFPLLSLFTSRMVKAGEELCWDYRYEVYDPTHEYDGDVRTMQCLCGAKNCHGTFKLSGQLKSTGGS